MDKYIYIQDIHIQISDIQIFSGRVDIFQWNTLYVILGARALVLLGGLNICVCIYIYISRTRRQIILYKG